MIAARIVLRLGLVLAAVALPGPAGAAEQAGPHAAPGSRTAPEQAPAEGQHRSAGGLAVYLGVVPAQLVKGAPHDRVPRGVHQLHLVAAIFDDVSGDRIGDAEVTATLSVIGHVGGTRIELKPMTMAGAATYGGFLAVPAQGPYTIRLEIKRSPVIVEFPYEHRLR